MEYTPKQQRILNGVHHKIELLRKREQQTKKTVGSLFKKPWVVPAAAVAMALLVALLAANPFLGQQFDEAAPQQLADAGGLGGAEDAEYGATQEEQAASEAMPQDGVFYSQGAGEEAEQFSADSCDPAGAEDTNSAFSLALLSAALKEEQGSVAVSPAAAELSLLMLYTEAYGDTKQELARVLYAHSEADALAKAAAIRHAFSENAGLLDVSLSLEKGAAFDAEFIENARDHFGAQANRESAESNGKQHAQPEDGVRAKLTVFNAANMRNGAENAAADEAHVQTGEQAKAPLHQTIEEMDYAQLDGLHYVTLPYTQNSRIMLILPEEGMDVQTAANTMEQAGLDAMLSRMEKQTVRLLMPDFDISSDTDLAPALRQMGLSRLFDEERCELNLTQEGVGGVYVEQMLQNCGVGMQGPGAEASEAEDTVFSMALHGPFLYIVYSVEGDMVLACGSVAGAHE
jgi:serine protease inhibitor